MSQFGFVKLLDPETDRVGCDYIICKANLAAMEPVADRVDPVVRELLTDLLATEGYSAEIDYHHPGPQSGEHGYKWHTPILSVELDEHNQGQEGVVWLKLGLKHERPNGILLAQLLTERTGVRFRCV